MSRKHISLNAAYKGYGKQAELAIEENKQLRAELETERMRLAACGVVADSNTKESAERNRKMNPEYRSASLDSVIRLVDSEMQLRADLAAAQERIAELENQHSHRANEWADCAVNGLQWLRNIRDDISTVGEAISSMESNIKYCRGVKEYFTRFEPKKEDKT